MGDVNKIINLLTKEYPNPKYYLEVKTPLELLVAAILSAQCRDEIVNSVIKELFKKYKKPSDYVAATEEELQQDIKSIPFFRNKGKNIQNACKIIINEHEGKVPKTMEDLIALPGVARKTANVILGHSYGIASGIAVDTHVIRLSNRLGLSSEKNPVKIEKDLMEIVPENIWIKFPLIMKTHGRDVCDAKCPKCMECFLKKDCPSFPVECNAKKKK